MIEIRQGSLDAGRYESELRDDACGGLCIFEGRVRDHHEGKQVTYLEYHCYEGMALWQMECLERETRRRWSIGKLGMAHRTGEIPVGELAVWVGVATVHRAEAFAACRFLIDEVKRIVPIWKKEYYGSGVCAWVGCRHEECAPRQ